MKGLLAAILLILPLCAWAQDLVAVPAGTFRMGDAAGEQDEVVREVALAGFRLMRREVTNAEFAAFVAATGHLTGPERKGKGYVWNARWRLVAGAGTRTSARCPAVPRTPPTAICASARGAAFPQGARPSGSTTWRATSGNGPRAPFPAGPARSCCAAAAGATTPGACA